MTSQSGDGSSRLCSGSADKQAAQQKQDDGEFGDDSVFCPPPDYDANEGDNGEAKPAGQGKPATGSATGFRQPAHRRGSQEWEVLRELRFAVSSASGSAHFQQQQQLQQQNCELARVLRERELRRRRGLSDASAGGCCGGGGELYAKFREIRAKSEAAAAAAAARDSGFQVSPAGSARVASLVQKFQQQQQQRRH